MSAQDYEYELPEGFFIKPEHRILLDQMVDECGLSNEQAQKFISLHCEIVNDMLANMELAETEQDQ